MMLFNKTVLVSILGVSLLQGCAEVQLNKPTDALYRGGEQSFRKGKYEDAIAQWKKVKESYPSPELSARTEISIAEAYYLHKDYIEAAAEYESFRKLHPGNEWAEYALFRQGMSYYKQINSIDTDQTPVKNTLAIFESYRKLYPNGSHTAEVVEKIRDCLDKQLQYEIYVASFYLRTGIRPAAIARLEAALKSFPDLPRREELLFWLGRAYREAGQKDKAREQFERQLREFPSGPHADQAKKVVGSL